MPALFSWPATAPADLIDAPARAALLNARSGFLPVLAPAVLGAGLVAIASTAGAAMSGSGRSSGELLRGLAEAVGFAAPVFALMLTSSHEKLSPASVLSLVCVATGVAGLASVLMVPLLGFLWLCADGSHALVSGFATAARLVAVPATFMLAVSLVLVRGLRAMGVASSWSGVGFGCLAFATFLLRVSPLLRGGA
ncbi:MAG: hypothetical protein Q8L14_26430 [Myxococcales bacterium]|nr:hypothetical protein [Myxococcales bacterium]